MWSLTANKEWSAFEQKAEREFEISVAYIAACNLSAFVPEQNFFFQLTILEACLNLVA